MNKDLLECFKEAKSPKPELPKGKSKNPNNDIFKKIEEGLCSEDKLMAFAKKGSSGIKRHLVKAPNITDEIISVLSTDFFDFVRESIIEKATGDVLVRLAKDKSSKVKFSLLQRNNLPSSVLRMLYEDVDSKIRSAVASHHNTDLDILAMLSYEFPDVVANNKNADSFILDNIINFVFDDKNNSKGFSKSFIGRAVFNNKNVSPETVSKLESKTIFKKLTK